MEKNYQVKETISGKKQVVIAVVHTAAAGLGASLKNIKGDEERTKFIRDYIHAVRFFKDQSGYFFVYKNNGLNIALPYPKENEGKNLKDYQDPKGNYVIQEAAAAAKRGGGFIQYYWVKPGTKSELKKTAYVEAIPGTDYLIGTGYYE